MFNHETVVLPEVTTKNIDGKRFYLTPEGNKYPSITTVLNGRKADGLVQWRKRVGNDVANHVMRTAASRGTKVHQMCEDYLNNEFDETKHKKDFLPYCLFKELSSQLLCKIDNIRSQECGLYSDKYKVAGRVDCIAEYDGVLSIIDFKTSKRERSDDWNENYYIQGSAYAEMFEERTSQPISQVVILVATEDGTVQEFIKDKTDYLPLLKEAVSVFRTKEQNSEKLTA